jgi:hypothetical protein
MNLILYLLSIFSSKKIKQLKCYYYIKYIKLICNRSRLLL